MIILYIRHGDPIYNPDCLTPLGKKQAEALSKRMSVYGVNKIYTSTSNRAYETALPLSELLHKQIIKVDFLNEDNAFKYFSTLDKDGKNRWIFEQDNMKRELVRDSVYKSGYEWYDLPQFSQYKFKEGIEFFDSNIDKFMITLGYEHNRKEHTYKSMAKNDERIAIFAHGGVGRNFLSSVLDVPYPYFAVHSVMSHTGMTVIDFDSSGEEIIPRMLQYSGDGHLYKEGLPTYHCNKIPI